MRNSNYTPSRETETQKSGFKVGNLLKLGVAVACYVIMPELDSKTSLGLTAIVGTGSLVDGSFGLVKNEANYILSRIKR